MANRITIATHNLRLDLPVDGPNRFFARFPYLPAYWERLACDVFAFQEVTPAMMTAIREAMPDYEIVGDYRSPGAEACPVAYRKDRFELVDAKTIWLTDTPDAPSKDPESKYPRIATIVVLKTQAGVSLQIACVHLDYASEALQLRQIEHAAGGLRTGLPTVLLGDFNNTRTSLSCMRMEELGFENVVARFGLNGATYHNFTDRLEGEPIDQLFVGGGWKAVSARIDRSRPPHGYYSDHDPVIAVLETAA
jgi:endonuclease/exonuclease/phosphatase family metal-dependent hydrolase